MRYIFRRDLELGSVRLLRDKLGSSAGICSKARGRPPHGGGFLSRGALYELLANPFYVSEVRHKTRRHSGQPEVIVGAIRRG